MEDEMKRSGQSADEGSMVRSASVHEEILALPVELAAVLQTVPCAAFILRGDVVVAQNELAAEQTGLDPEQPWPAARIFLGAFPAAGSAAAMSATAIEDAGAGEAAAFECLLVRADGKPAMVQGALREAGGGWRLAVVLPRRADAAGEAEGHGSFLGDLLDSAPEAIAITHDGLILHVNREFTRLFGYAAATCIGRDIDELLLPDGRLHENEILYHMVAQEGRASLETVRRAHSKQLVDVSLLVAPVRLNGSAHGLYYTYRDIHEQKEAEARLQHLAMHDALTGLANRALFGDRLNLMMARLQRRPDRRFAVLFLDLDHFKQVNDTLGHAAGDALLLEMARRLGSCVRPQDTLARFGGDEFAILLDEAVGHVDVGGVAERIQRAAQQPVVLDGDEVRVSASIGIALVDDAFRTPEQVVHAADLAMYRAKANGKGRHEFAGDAGGATIQP